MVGKRDTVWGMDVGEYSTVELPHFLYIKKWEDILRSWMVKLGRIMFSSGC